MTEPDHAAEHGPLHPILAARFSPVRFDPAHRLSDAQEATLVEAARWAPSAGNSQPWLFHLARRGTPAHEVLLAHLAPSAMRWAVDASALVVNLAHHTVDDSDLPYSDFADYDLGQAVAHMTLQATAMGLACRQFRAFDLEALTRRLDIPPGWQIRTMTAIGRTGPGGEGTPRQRRDGGDLRLG